MADAWLKKLDKEELAAMIPLETLTKVDDPDAAMKDLSLRMARQGQLVQKGSLQLALSAPKKKGSKGPSPAAAKKASSVVGVIKDEIYIFLCTDDPKYKKTKEEIDKYKGSATLTLVSMIAAGIASVLGVLAAAVVPFVAIALYAILGIGKNVYCRLAKP